MRRSSLCRVERRAVCGTIDMRLLEASRDLFKFDIRLVFEIFNEISIVIFIDI